MRTSPLANCFTGSIETKHGCLNDCLTTALNSFRWVRIIKQWENVYIEAGELIELKQLASHKPIIYFKVFSSFYLTKCLLVWALEILTA